MIAIIDQYLLNEKQASEAGSSGTSHVSIVPVASQATNGTTTKAEVELDAKITKVKDVLCDLGEGFIEVRKKIENLHKSKSNTFIFSEMSEALQLRCRSGDKCRTGGLSSGVSQGAGQNASVHSAGFNGTLLKNNIIQIVLLIRIVALSGSLCSRGSGTRRRETKRFR